MNSTAEKTETAEKPDKATIVDLVPIDPAITLITKAEIDTQIATAHAFPRSLHKFMRDVMSMATVSADVAESCIYALPRGGKSVEGPSIRLAEMVAASYGNLRTGARVVYNDGKHVTAQGIVHDLEKNIMHTEEVKRSIMQHEWKDGQRTGKMVTMNEDMQTVTGRAACAIAYRNAIFKVVPAALINDILEKVRDIAKGTAETLVARRDKAMAYFKYLGIKEKQVFDALEVKGLEDIDLDKLVVLRGMATALKNGEATVDGLFPKPDQKAKADQASKATADKLNKKPGANAAKDTAQQMGSDITGVGENKPAE